MKKKEKEELKKIYNKEVKELNNSIKTYKKKNKGKLDDPDHLRELRIFEVQLAKYKQGLVDIKTKDFGVCQNCKNEVPFTKLKQFPDAKLCSDCSETPNLLFQRSSFDIL